MATDYHLDVDTVSNWPLKKIYEYMAFHHSETETFKKEHMPAKPNEPISFEEIVRQMELEGVKFKDD